MNVKKNHIAHYYEVCESDYRNFWDLDRSLALHAGYWDETTRTLHEALIKENEVLAESIKVKSSDHILDAGCGVGGSALFLAGRYHCRVTGITLSEKQMEQAKRHAHQRHLEHLVDFHVMDFCKTTFPNETFDVVWGLESVCHAASKQFFAQEAFRVLKPKGRLIIADGFANKKFYVPQDAEDMNKWLNGWGVDALETVDFFASYLEESGFQQIVFKEITKNILPSSKKLFYISLPAIIFSKAGELFGLRTKIQTANIRSAYYQYKTLKKKLWKYGILSAKKD